MLHPLVGHFEFSGEVNPIRMIPWECRLNLRRREGLKIIPTIIKTATLQR